ncbi:peroxisome biogenesis factor 1 isoform X2 [Nematostella vectensis]|uniref:peroxisome biogenesis factor 1 isoform X2 n=1 Tax=Nematostella vectensis TaxID=45351 RepID=UPI0020773458|nr:peroxisome biogenesis factor 1 isoform X2 [Nematostella vectensis]
MADLTSAVVRLGSTRSCFIAVSAEFARSIGHSVTEGQQHSIVAFVMQWPGKTMNLSWSGAVVNTAAQGHELQATVEINRKLAKLNGLHDGQQVVLKRITSIPSCMRMYVDPLSADDWEIVELHAGKLEASLLDQVRVVGCGQLLPVFIDRSTSITIVVKATEPSLPCVLLEQMTEVIISPRNRMQQQVEMPLQTTIDHHKDNIPKRSSMPPGKVSSIETQDSSLSRVFEYLRWLAYGENNQVTESIPDDVSPCQTEPSSSSGKLAEGNQDEACCEQIFKTANIDMTFRVQRSTEILYGMANKPCKHRKRLQLCMSQPNAAFLDATSLPQELLQCEQFHAWRKSCLGWTKIVLLQKILSPSEKARLLSDKKTKNEAAGEQKQSHKKDNPAQTSQENIAFGPKAVVKLVLTENHHQCVPKDETWKGSVIIPGVECKGNALEHESVSCNRGETYATLQRPDRGSSATVPRPQREPCATILSQEGRNGTQAAFPVTSIPNESVHQGHVLLHKQLQQDLGCILGSSLRITHIDHGPDITKGIILHVESKANECLKDSGPIVQAFKEWVLSVSSDECPLVLGDTMKVDFSFEGITHPVVVSILSQCPAPTQHVPYFLLSPDTLQRVSVVVDCQMEHIRQPLACQDVEPKLKCSIQDLGGVTAVFTKCLERILSCLDFTGLPGHLSSKTSVSSRALLIHGCGRTSLAHALCSRLGQWPVCAHVVVVNCIHLRAKRVEAVQKHLQQAFTEAAWYQQSVLLLDDLDHVVSSPGPMQEAGGEGLYRLRLAQVFKDMVANEIASNGKVAVIATSESRDSLHGALLSSRGCHVFENIVELSLPDERQRLDMLSALAKRKLRGACADNLDMSLVAKKADGFSPKDLNSLVDRALHFASVRQLDKDPVTVSNSDIEQAITGFVPAALRGVPLHQAGHLGWENVGGLGTVKGVLQETLLWPSKFAGLFAKCPLRLRGGLLLYGPPGTGKTLLAGVVAKECGLNFISIKGPELLSKYIGASEQAVRDMFTRAQSAKPCILFFDEFDSLAPRRGHDSTGVTDRVVNQLLTQLDGVEGLKGVYILAATSRPDLIDPALLRPGRLDKCVYCPIPDQGDRREVFRALSHDLPLADDIDLDSISDSCHHFTGADIKALLYNSQLEAIHRTTSKIKLYGGALDGATCLRENIDGAEQAPRDASKLSERGHRSDTDAPGHEDGSKGSRKGVIMLTVGGGVQSVTAEDAQGIEAEPEPRVTTNTNVNIKRPLTIIPADILRARAGISPSVSEHERLRYQHIYESFVTSRGGDLQPEKLGHGRATLA